MRDLINFILRNVHWLLFIVLLAVSVFFIVQNNQFQRSRYLLFSHEISGRIQNLSAPIRSHKNLRQSNDELLERLTFLETELIYYKSKFAENRLDSIFSGVFSEEPNLKYIPAFVVYNRISGVDNYITINKGSNDGLKPDMGVVSARGVVGVVVNVFPNFAKVIPLLNPEFRPGGKIKRTNYFGPMIWDGKDPRYTHIEELPRHAVYELGDTIVTSGYSKVFPEGVPIGVIEGLSEDKNDGYISLKVKLFTDFGNLHELMVVSNRLRDEQVKLEEGGRK